MTNVASPSVGVATGAGPYSTLFLLPSAPRQLVVETYHLLSLASSNGGDEALRSAYARIMAVSTAGPRSTSRQEDAGAIERWHNQYPWDVLHIRREAPASVVDVACRVRSGAAGPLSRGAPTEGPGRELNGVAHDQRPGMQSDEPPIVTRTEPGGSLAARAQQAARGLFRRHEQTDGGPEEARRWSEIRAPCGVARHLSPSAPAAERKAEETRAHLVSEAAGTGAVRAPIGSEPLTIGRDSAGDIELAESRSGRSAGVVARIWAGDGGIMLHSLGDEPAVLLNGRRMTWALLEDGDRLEIGSDVLRFESPRPAKEPGGEAME